MSDHASTEKAKADKIRERKHEEVVQELGEKALQEMLPEALQQLLHQSHVAKVEAAGGFEAWVKMDPVEAAHLDVAQYTAMTAALGQDVYDKL